MGGSFRLYKRMGQLRKGTFMVNYIHIENGIIKEGPVPLPISWRNISGLNGFSEEELKAMNWIALNGEKPEINRYQTISDGEITIYGSSGNYSASIEWTISFRPKEEIIAMRNREIDVLREENIARGAIVDLGDSNGPFTVQTRGELDTRNITGLAGVATTALLLEQPFSADFRDQGDQVHTLNAQQILMLQAQIAVWVQSHYYTAWTHKANLKALYDSDDIQGMVDYDISQGWP